MSYSDATDGLRPPACPERGSPAAGPLARPGPRGLTSSAPAPLLRSPPGRWPASRTGPGWDRGVPAGGVVRRQPAARPWRSAGREPRCFARVVQASAEPGPTRPTDPEARSPRAGTCAAPSPEAPEGPPRRPATVRASQRPRIAATATAQARPLVLAPAAVARHAVWCPWPFLGALGVASLVARSLSSRLSPGRRPLPARQAL